MGDRRPIIGISCDVAEPPPGAPPPVRARFQLGDTYCRSVWAAGGVPVIMPAIVESIGPMLEHLDGVVISGGDDIDTRPFGIDLHPQARIMHPQRQAFELALLAAAGFRSVSVGPTILRFETAAVAALAAARMVFGTAPSSCAETQPEPLEGA